MIYTWLWRTIVIVLLTATSLITSDPTRCLLWTVYAMIFYVICRIEDIAKHIGEK